MRIQFSKASVINTYHILKSASSPVTGSVLSFVCLPIFQQKTSLYGSAMVAVSGDSKGLVTSAEWTAKMLPTPLPYYLLVVCHLHT